jgi:hypothetical protein
MPCDTRYTTSKLDVTGMDPTMLAQALEASGWTVTIMQKGSTVRGHARSVTLAIDLLVARKGAATINVRASGAKVRSTSEADVERVQGEIRQAYGTRAAQVSLARFGFKQIGNATKQADGAVKLTFKR